VTITPEILDWLHRSAERDGAAYSQVLLHLLERVEALEQRPIPGFVDLAAPTPEPFQAILRERAAALAQPKSMPTDDELREFIETLRNQWIRTVISGGEDPDSDDFDRAIARAVLAHWNTPTAPPAPAPVATPLSPTAQAVNTSVLALTPYGVARDMALPSDLAVAAATLRAVADLRIFAYGADDQTEEVVLVSDLLAIADELEGYIYD